MRLTGNRGPQHAHSGWGDKGKRIGARSTRRHRLGRQLFATGVARCQDHSRAADVPYRRRPRTASDSLHPTRLLAHRTYMAARQRTPYERMVPQSVLCHLPTPESCRTTGKQYRSTQGSCPCRGFLGSSAPHDRFSANRPRPTHEDDVDQNSLGVGGPQPCDARCLQHFTWRAAGRFRTSCPRSWQNWVIVRPMKSVSARRI